jgi:hypothetical protein
MHSQQSPVTCRLPWLACLLLQDGGAVAAAAALAGPHSLSVDADGETAAAEAAGSDGDGKLPMEQQQHMQLPAFSPSQPKQSSLAHRLAVELNCLSQGHSQHAASPGAAVTGGNGAQYDTGDEDDEQQGTTGGSQGTAGGRPQRMRKPKQYLGEPTGTPRGGPRGGSLPGTPGSSTRRKVSDETVWHTIWDQHRLWMAQCGICAAEHA